MIDPTNLAARLARAWERGVRRMVATVPAAAIVASALGSAWLLHQQVRRRETARAAESCFHVIAAPTDGRLAWVREKDPWNVQRGDVVARLEAHGPSGGLRSAVKGAIRTVIKRPGDAVRKGDPVIIVEPSGKAACR